MNSAEATSITLSVIALLGSIAACLLKRMKSSCDASASFNENIQYSVNRLERSISEIEMEMQRSHVETLV